MYPRRDEETSCKGMGPAGSLEGALWLKGVLMAQPWPTAVWTHCCHVGTGLEDLFQENQKLRFLGPIFYILEVNSAFSFLSLIFLTVQANTQHIYRALTAHGQPLYDFSMRS